jgi:hypothetical protein
MWEPIESEYFYWLCHKVQDRHNHNYDGLLQILHKTEFVWVVPADRHRLEDGLELREKFLDETGIDTDPYWEHLPCSILEVFISFADRASFQTDIPLNVWFWEIIANLKLDEFRQVSSSDRYQVDDILYNFIWRQYSPNGSGGMFPLSRTENDQREVEIWYQFSEYVEDRGLF